MMIRWVLFWLMICAVPAWAGPVIVYDAPAAGFGDIAQGLGQLKSR